MPIVDLDATHEAYVQLLDEAEPADLDPVTFEIIQNRLETIANEMGIAVHRTAHTAIFAETKDFSCAIFDHRGRMVATGEFLPAHQAGAQSALDGLIGEVGLGAFHDGDVFMVNDALYGAWHTSDVTLFTPVFHSDQLVAILGVVVHHIDMGGMTPSSYCPEATEIYQEGIRFPPTTRLYEKGELRRDILNIFLTNIRLPKQQQGDLMAQVAGLNAGRDRVHQLAAKHGADTMQQYFIGMQVNGVRMMKKAIRDFLPNGIYEAEDFVDGDGVEEKSYRVACRMTVTDEALTFDFDGTDPAAPGFINAHWSTTSANVYAATFSYLIPNLPKTHGATVPITIVAEKGSLVNCPPTAAIGACTTESGYAIHDAALLCLAKAYPEMASGIWGGTVGIPLVWGTDPRSGEYLVTMLESGTGMGGGGRKTMDGWPTASLKSSNVTLPNIEVEEQVYPVFYRYRKLSRDDEPGGAGPGRMRGGPGCNFEVQSVGTTLGFTTIVNKTRHPAAGVLGGHPGGLSHVEVIDTTDQTIRVLPSKITNQTLSPHEVLHFAVTGGGGYGDPLERDPEAVRLDVLDGYVSVESARSIYGVCLDPATFEIDLDQTRALRKA